MVFVFILQEYAQPDALVDRLLTMADEVFQDAIVDVSTITVQMRCESECILQNGVVSRPISSIEMRYMIGGSLLHHGCSNWILTAQAVSHKKNSTSCFAMTQ